MNRIVPVTELAQLPEAGRIRTGIFGKTKGGKNMAMSIETFRFTSTNRRSLDQLAELYGGEVRPWSNPKANPPNQFELISEASEIEVLVQPGGVDVGYELWGGGGLSRRCDGLVCTQWQRRGSDVVSFDSPCVCSTNELLECGPKTRVQVIFPSIDFSGTWRYESSGQHASRSLPSMTAIIEQLQERSGLIPVIMASVPRSEVKAGQKRNYRVVEIRMKMSVDQMLGGQTYQTMLTTGRPQVAELQSGADSPSSSTPPSPSPSSTSSPVPPEVDDDDIVDAELVEEEGGSAMIAPDPDLMDDERTTGLTRDKAMELARERGMSVRRNEDGTWDAI